MGKIIPAIGTSAERKSPPHQLEKLHLFQVPRTRLGSATNLISVRGHCGTPEAAPYAAITYIARGTK